MRGLTLGTLPSYAVVNLDPDPLFEPVQAGLAIFDPAETALAVWTTSTGTFPSSGKPGRAHVPAGPAHGRPLSSEACNSINLPGGCRLSDMVPFISIMDMGRRVEIRGGLGLGSTLVDLLVQEYAQWPQQDAAWGQANAAALRKLLPIRSEIFNARTARRWSPASTAAPCCDYGSALTASMPTRVSTRPGAPSL